MRTFLRCLPVVFFFTAASMAQAKTIDLKNQTDADGSAREISFCARPSPEKLNLPGHAFIAFSETKKDGSLHFRAIGHTAYSVGEALLSYTGLIPANGALVNENYSSVKQECLTVQVNQRQYDKSYEIATQPLKSIGIIFDENQAIQKSYSLAAEDCVGFIITQAKFFGSKLTVPVRKPDELPLNYIRRLIDAN